MIFKGIPNGKKWGQDCRGFTLMELMVVVVIIAILASVGLPTFRNFISKSEIAEAMEQCGAIVRGITLFVDQHPTITPADLMTNFSTYPNLGGADDQITTLIPELGLPTEATFNYLIRVAVADNREVHLCISAWKPSNPDAILLFSSVASNKPEWNGKFYDKTYLDTTVAGVDGGYCDATGGVIDNAG
ncbi:MAG: prepilin-type N-terminal cleavage/methylation domain-containing protein [Magnetococcus sp. DMHC-6]